MLTKNEPSGRKRALSYGSWSGFIMLRSTFIAIMLCVPSWALHSVASASDLTVGKTVSGEIKISASPAKAVRMLAGHSRMR